MRQAPQQQPVQGQAKLKYAKIAWSPRQYGSGCLGLQLAAVKPQCQPSQAHRIQMSDTPAVW